MSAHTPEAKRIRALELMLAAHKSKIAEQQAELTPLRTLRDSLEPEQRRAAVARAGAK